MEGDPYGATAAGPVAKLLGDPQSSAGASA